ncbi:hypothetical protein [Xenorhabdus miraniensis]|uniref:hypothetical protein n=1 Tax=Xenorhabdus miraniensis TaxID=351674 RepID=UPI0030DC4792
MESIATPGMVGCGKSNPLKPLSFASAGYKSVENAERLTGGSVGWRFENGHMKITSWL